MAFEGFVPPTKNYFPVPNNWIDICATIRDISELKVIQYVIRHTWGFHEFGICKTISVDEFMHGRRRQDQTRMDCGTGLSEQSVRNGLNKAIKDGYLICEVDPSDAGRIKKSYALRMQANTGQAQTLAPPQTLDPSTGTNFIPQGTNPYTSDSQSLDPRVPKFRPRTEKDTIERHLEKDTLERIGDIVVSANAENDAPAANVHDIELMRQRKTDPRIPAVSRSQSAIGNEEPHQYTYAELAVRNLQLDKEIDEMERAEAERNIVDSTIEDISLQETQQRLPAVPKQTPAAGAAIPPSSGAGVQAPSPISNSTPEQRSGASPAGIPASPGAAQARQVIPKRPLHKVIEKPQLTFGGQQVREWYEQARECKVRMTDKNVITLNRLADIDEMTQENLRDVLELYDTDKWLIDHNVTVDLQELEKQDGKFTFERGLLAVKRKRRAKGTANNISKNGTDLNQYGLQALLQRQEQKAV